MKKYLLFLFFLLIFQLSLSAHPHMLLTTRLDFEFTGKTCRGFWVEWGFDGFFSAVFIKNYDRDGNGSFDKEELRELHDRAFLNLEKYGYFVFIRNGETRIQPKKVEGFTAWQKERQLFYRFFVPLNEKDTGEDFSISIFDPTFYCAVRYQDPPAAISPGSHPGIVYSLEENKNYPVYYDPLGLASDNSTYTSWRKGLETAYPQEIRISVPAE